MNKGCKYFSALMVLLLAGYGFSATSSPVQTKVIMSGFLEQLNAVKKYMVSETRFADPKNKVEISEHLKQFSQIADATMHDPQLQLDNFKLSRDVLVKHIHETEKIFREGNKDYARWMLNSTVYVCMSCHTQTPSADKRPLLETDSGNYFSQFEQAEFLFASRSFSEASRIYDLIIRGMVNDANPEVEKSLQRQVAYFARVKRAPKQAIKTLNEYLKLKNTPDYIRRDLVNWISQFEKWKNGKDIDPARASGEAIIDFAKSQIGSDQGVKIESSNPKLVNYLRVSGVLYQFLHSHPQSKFTPQILYWLAICERSIEHNFFFSLADLYLRECITKYASDPVAKKCYAEFEKETVLGYSGSRGVDVPASVRDDLKALKKLIESGEKKSE